MSALDPRIELIRNKYGLDRDDFWELPQKKGTWLVKHRALELVALKAGVHFDAPQVIEADTKNGIAVVSVFGSIRELKKDAGKDHPVFEQLFGVWSIGEAAPGNNKNAYPWAMAEKRAKDRVTLKLIGLHGLVYSEDEAEFDDGPKAKVKVADQRSAWEIMRDELDACETASDLALLWASKSFQNDLKMLKPDWRQQIEDHKDDLKDRLIASSPTIPTARSYIAPSFEGVK